MRTVAERAGESGKRSNSTLVQTDISLVITNDDPISEKEEESSGTAPVSLRSWNST